MDQQTGLNTGLKGEKWIVQNVNVEEFWEMAANAGDTDETTGNLGDYC